MTALTEPFHAGGYIVSEANGHRSRETVTIKSGADLLAGTVLGKITTGAQSVGAPAAFASNAGDGSPGTFTADAGAPAGDYKIVFIEPVTNLGTFQVFKPDGTLDGTGKVGTAYNGSINGTIADGTNDFVAGDGFTVTVSYAAGSANMPFTIRRLAMARRMRSRFCTPMQRRRAPTRWPQSPRATPK